MSDVRTNEVSGIQSKFQRLISTQDYIEDFDLAPTESAEDEELERHRADVPVGPDEHDKKVPSSVAQGD